MAFQPPVPLLSALVLALALSCTAAGAAEQAGEVGFARGLVTAYGEARTARIVGPGSPVLVGEVIATGARSVAILKLTDGTRITLRPDSSFEIEAFDTRENQEQALLRLFKGGLRAVTGFVSKRNSNAMRLRTSVATIGIRGTEFDVRLCGEDCAAEASRRPAPAGRAAFARGTVIARTASGAARGIEPRSPVYAGDTLVTGAGGYAVIAFRDESRVTLLPNTEFKVERLQFDEAYPDTGSAVFRLVRGGLRAVTGFIGRRDGRGYRMRTSVATIGIRGTGYDALCQGTCQNPDPGADPSGDGLFTEVWDGTIVLDETYEVDAGEVVFIPNTGIAPVPVPGLPVNIDQPRPDTVDVPDVPPPPSSSAPEEGLYVSCYAGECDIETPTNTVELEAGQAGFVGGAGSAEALPEVPPFQAEDPVLQAVQSGQTLNQFSETFETGEFECTVR